MENDIEQLIDLWSGRETYGSDTEWLENVGAQIALLAEKIGKAL